MLWRVRTSLPDRPGALATLARSCGDAEVNILGLQIFPGVGAVTDELVLRTPAGWGPREVAQLVAGAGGDQVQVGACTEAALADQPTRYVTAARTLLDNPMAFPEVLAGLFDTEHLPTTETEPGAETISEIGPGDLMELTVGDVVMQVRRAAAYTATEHARGAALADLVSDVLRRTSGSGPAGAPVGGRRLGTGVAPDYLVDGAAVSAVVDGVVVGLASVLPGDDPLVRTVTLRVDPAWQRRGIGTRLLTDVSRLAHAMGAEEILLTAEAGNQAVLPMVMAAGLHGRIRMAGDTLVVRVPVAGLKPLPT